MLSSAPHPQRLARRTLALVLAGGRGSRLKQLTDRRAKPAVFFGGKFRVIDFALSSCLNSGVRRICVLTQYKAHSLLRHLQMGWSFLRPEMNEFLDLLPAQQRLDEATWYRGTADAVYQNFDIFRAADPEYFIDFEFDDKNPVTLVSAPTGCSASVAKPKPLEEGDKKKLDESFFTNLSPGSNFGFKMASSAIIACP